AVGDARADGSRRRRRGAAGLRPHGRRGAARHARRRDGHHGLRRPALPPPAAVAQHLRPFLARRRGAEPDRPVQRRLPALVPVCWPLALALGRLTRWSLAASDTIVDLADRVPGGHWYVGSVPEWWLWAFYLTLLSGLMLESLRRHRRWFALAGLTWLCVGLVG